MVGRTVKQRPHAVIQKDVYKRQDGICHICTKPQEEEIQRQKEMRQQKKATQQIEMQEISGWINTRRLHAADTYQQACEQLWKEIQQKYHYIKETETGRRILVLGTEEFMYPALYVGAKLEEAGYTAVSYTHLIMCSPIKNKILIINMPKQKRCEISR